MTSIICKQQTRRKSIFSFENNKVGPANQKRHGKSAQNKANLVALNAQGGNVMSEASPLAALEKTRTRGGREKKVPTCFKK